MENSLLNNCGHVSLTLENLFDQWLHTIDQPLHIGKWGAEVIFKLRNK
ncbi:MAG: hypothetical protein ACTSWY_10375 [Promethearchaeota archaeon]